MSIMGFPLFVWFDKYVFLDTSNAISQGVMADTRIPLVPPASSISACALSPRRGSSETDHMSVCVSSRITGGLSNPMHRRRA